LNAKAILTIDLFDIFTGPLKNGDYEYQDPKSDDEV
jgi:hypothetical protein